LSSQGYVDLRFYSPQPDQLTLCSV